MLEFCEESLEIGMLKGWRFIESWSSSAGVCIQEVLEQTSAGTSQMSAGTSQISVRFASSKCEVESAGS